MTIEQKIKVLAVHAGIKQADIARLIEMSPQNFNKKLKRETFSQEELEQIAEACGAKYMVGFELPDGTKI